MAGHEPTSHMAQAGMSGPFPLVLLPMWCKMQCISIGPSLGSRGHFTGVWPGLEGGVWPGLEGGLGSVCRLWCLLLF